MKDLRAFLRRHIEVFLDHEFGTGMQNATPRGIRRILWTPEHTARLINHLAGNWAMVEEAQRLQQDGGADTADPGEIAADNAQADAAAAEYDGTPEDEKPPVNPEVPW
jgi:hypothetical protein